MDQRTAAQRKHVREDDNLRTGTNAFANFGERSTLQEHISDLVDIGRIPIEKVARRQTEERLETRHSIGLEAF
jgi:hypothetical protein